MSSKKMVPPGEQCGSPKRSPQSPSPAGDWRRQRSPVDPWKATGEQRQAADLRVRIAASRAKAARVTVNARDLRLVMHDKGLAELHAEACGWIRDASVRVTGGNCAFADDDLAILEHLAMRAVDAGLVDGLHPTVAVKALTIAEERRNGSAEGVPAQVEGEGSREDPS